MAIYTVHEPPPGRRSLAAHTDRFVFVRDGFYVWALLLAPLWMLWRRLWVALVLYLLVVGGGLWGLTRLGVSTGTLLGVLALVSLLIGLEASSLWRWTLERRGWRNVGVVAADTSAEAERRFFDYWVEPAFPAQAATSAASWAGARRPSSDPGVIGLFPEPGARP